MKTGTAPFLLKIVQKYVKLRIVYSTGIWYLLPVMSKKTLFHGTSAQHLRSVRKHGLKINSSKIWRPSENAIYFWSPDALVEAGECENDEWKNGYAIDRAYESAQIAMACDPKSNGKCIVLEVEIDESEIEPDSSCDNMSGAVCIRRDILPSEIKSVSISPDLGMMKGYFIAQVMGNNLFDSSQLTENEKRVAEIFSKSEFFFDLGDFPLEAPRPI